jgi:hypothetical protein
MICHPDLQSFFPHRDHEIPDEIALRPHVFGVIFVAVARPVGKAVVMFAAANDIFCARVLEQLRPLRQDGGDFVIGHEFDERESISKS